jgi:hypothetical protein
VIADDEPPVVFSELVAYSISRRWMEFRAKRLRAKHPDDTFDVVAHGGGYVLLERRRDDE